MIHFNRNMSIEVNHILKAREIQDLIVPIFSPYLKGTTVTTIHPYLCGKTNSRIPFAAAFNQGYSIPTNYASAQYKFKGSLRASQIQIIDAAFKLLASKHCVLLSTHVGFGKTILAIYILSQLNYKTFIVCNRKILLEQWKESLEQFLIKPRVCILSAGQKLDYTLYDIFIINSVNIPKINDRLDRIGVLIVDEVHLILSQKSCQSLLYFTPRYFIGLSATPYRTDGSNKLFELFFGNTVIFKPLLRAHTLYKVLTSFSPTIIKNNNNKIDWGKLLKEQGEDPARNELIVKIISKFAHLKFIVLCKRIAQIELLEDLLVRAQISVYAIYGTTCVDRTRLTEPDKGGSRVILGTFQKLGVGFDDKTANALLLAADVEEYYIQYFGRVFRNPDIEPVIFDLVDSCRILNKHHEARSRVSREAGQKEVVILDYRVTNEI